MVREPVVENASPTIETNQRSLKRAILEGEAYALGFRGHLGTAKILANGVLAKLGRSSNLAESVARSFGGAPTDTFVREKLSGIHGRVAKAGLKGHPRRGFDALVDALRSEISDAAEPVEEKIAELLETSSDDVVVHNLAVRLRHFRSPTRG